MPNVELGFLEQCESWRLESRLFPSKVGGKPAWLSLNSIPTSDELTCKKCQKVMVFLCQVYAPYESATIDKQLIDNFHRTIFVFICRNSVCSEYGSSTHNIKIFRNSLAKENDFYSVNPPDDKTIVNFDVKKWSRLCNLCGISAQKICSQCKAVAYCCREHQIFDWKNGHKLRCSSDVKEALQSKHDLGIGFLYSEWELVTDTEEMPKNTFVSEEQAMDDFRKLQANGVTNKLDEVSESDLDVYASSETDKVFTMFKKTIKIYPDQVIRYSRGGKPLFIAKEPLPSHIPSCEYCGAPRQFEFQIMPQLLFELKEHNLDWGVLLIYTCKNSCIGESINSYKKEYVFKQDVSNTDLFKNC